MVLAEGDNYRIELADGIAVTTVWRRPDLDSRRGGELASEIAQKLADLAARPERRARALVLDLTSAPPVVGPDTQQALSRIFSAWADAGRRVGVATGEDNAVGAMQLRRLARQAAPEHARVASSREAARRWADEGTEP